MDTHTGKKKITAALPAFILLASVLFGAWNLALFDIVPDKNSNIYVAYAAGRQDETGTFVNTASQDNSEQTPTEGDQPQVPAEEQPSYHHTYVKENNTWVYYNKAGKACPGLDTRPGWVQNEGDWFYFDAQGNMVANSWVNIGQQRYLFDDGGRMLTGWQEVDGQKYYLGTSGAMVTGWQFLDNAWYYFNADGVMSHDRWEYFSGGQCYLGSDGAMLVNTVTPDGYRVNASGYRILGWVQETGGWRYYLTEGGFKTGWFDWNGARYYLDPETGIMATGWRLIDDEWYYLDPSGIMQTGWLDYYGTWYYLDSSGVMAHDRWENYRGGPCYLGPDGAMLVDTVTPDGYRVNASGYRIAGWVQEANGWRYYLTEGGYKTGWFDWNGARYYLDPETGIMATGWQPIGDEWYYLDSSGIMQTGWLDYYGTWYYLDSSGSMYRGWMLEGNVWYYFLDSGAMATGWQEIDNKRYRFDLLGHYSPGLSLTTLLNAVDACDSRYDVGVYGADISSTAYRNIQVDIDAIREEGYECAFMLVDLTTGCVIYSNTAEEFYGASAIKGPYVCACATGWPEKAAEWQSCAYSTISFSSNEDYKAMRYEFGSGVMRAYMEEARVSYFDPSTVWPSFRACDFVKLWLRNYDYFGNGEPNSDWLEPYFYHTSNSFIDAVLGNTYQICSKAGWIFDSSSYAYNDGGVVLKGEHPYVLGIMSSMNSDNSVCRQCLYTLVRDLDTAQDEFASL